MSRAARSIPLLLAVLSAAGCDIPADPEGTLERVRGGTLTVGVTHAEPWVDLRSGDPTGVEPTLIREFARTIDADVKWVRGSEAELVATLEGGQLDVVLAGFERRTPQRKHVALTRPYVDARLLIAAPSKEEVPEDLDGERIAVVANSMEAAVLEQKSDAEPAHVESLHGIAQPALVWDYWLDDLGLESSGRALHEEEHAMAVRLGENAFLVELERFLLDREADTRKLLDREGRP